MFRPTKQWALTALLTVLPVAAILHHRVFYPPTCMLQPLRAADYSRYVLGLWFRSDPSPTVALALAAGLLVLGSYAEWVRRPTLAFVIAFMPLALWIWDLPFSDRLICRLLHDGRAGFHTRHVFAFGVLAWFPMNLLLRAPHKAMPLASVLLVEAGD